MLDSFKLALAVALVAGTCGCSTPTPNPNQRETRETVTGSNIPRRESQPRSGATVIDKDSISDLIKSNGARGRPGG